MSDEKTGKILSDDEGPTETMRKLTSSMELMKLNIGIANLVFPG